jgi:hypothetical protein
MKAIVFILVVFLSGCAFLMLGTPFQAMDISKRITNSTVVTWELVDDVDATCRKIIPPVEEDTTIYGCTQWSTNSCKIYTGRTTTVAILGHELRHCFEGNWHE